MKSMALYISMLKNTTGRTIMAFFQEEKLKI